MPDYLHRSTLRHLRSVAEADLPEPLINYIEYPDLSAVAGVPVKYWAVTDDVISEMSQIEKDVVDVAEVQAQEDGELLELDAGILRRFVLVLLDEINRFRTADGVSTVTIAQLKNAMRGK